MASAGIRNDDDPASAPLASPVRRQAGGAGNTDESPPEPSRHETDLRDRAARLAALAAQIAAVEGRTVEASAGDLRRDRPIGNDLADGRSTTDDSVRDRSIDYRRSDQSRETAGEPPSRDQTAAAKAICLRLLAVAPRPRAGLAQALRRKEIPDNIAETVLDRLTEVGLIDDVAYAQSFVRTKHRDRALGRSALRMELRKLGVEDEIMAAAVETVDGSAERAMAAELIAKRVDAAMVAGPVAARRRLLGLLSRRGYSPEIAVPVVEHALDGYSEGANDRS